MPIVKKALTLEDLPAPPPDKTGWPWTEQTEPLPDRMPNGSEWPKISIVTPSYNQGQFIEETIRSVLLQGYPNLEYIIIDGGSTDSTTETIKKYEQYLAYWVSEVDEGQSDALNKGFTLSQGNICGYLNSDDLLLPKALYILSNIYDAERFKWISSSVLMGESLSSSQIWKPFVAALPLFVTNQTIAQQGVFWVADLMPKPYFDESRNYGMDHKFFTEIYLKHGPPQILDEVTAFFRIQPESKSLRLYALGEEENHKLIKEIIEKSDFNTAKSIQKEYERKKAVSAVIALLKEGPGSTKERIQATATAAKILLTAPFPLRDKIFISALIRLGIRLFKPM